MKIDHYASTFKLLRLLDAGVGVDALMASAAEAGEPAYVLMRMAQLFNIHAQTGQAWELQHEALQLRRHYSMAADRVPATVRLLVILKAGFMLDNTPFDFLIEDTDVACELLYVTPDLPLPERLPAHDVAFIAIGHFQRNRPLFDRLLPLLRTSTAPVLNWPHADVTFERDRISQLLQGIPGLLAPPTRIVARSALHELVHALPLIVRPLRSQAGIGLQRLLLPDDIAAYLAAQPEESFYVAPYIDYQGADGLYRKCRLLLLQGVPYVCHLAISAHWIVHYKSAGMEDSDSKRDEEARFMAGAEQAFLHRHRATLDQLAARIGIDYVVVDCAETAAGELLFFEADNVSIIHATDALDLFPYKQEQMRKVFAAFNQRLQALASTHHPALTPPGVSDETQSR